MSLTNIILEKVNLFFSENISRMTRTYKEIESSWIAIQKSSENRGKKKAISDMKFAVSETYLMTKKIEVYQTLNHTGFRKICKKHDKASFILDDLRNSSITEVWEAASIPLISNSILTETSLRFWYAALEQNSCQMLLVMPFFGPIRISRGSRMAWKK